MKKNLRAFSLIELSIVILIIGILVAGVTQSSRLVSQMRLVTARDMTESSPVPSIKGITVWFEATSEKSFATDPDDGATITNWLDINPHSLSKAQTTSTSGPTYKASCINGLPCLSFDGTANFLNTTTTSRLLGVDGTQISMFAVVQPQVLSHATNRYFIINNGAWGAGFISLFIYQNAGGTANRASYENWGAASFPVATTALTTGKAYVISQTDDGTSLKVFLNGGSGNTVTTTSGTKGNTTGIYFGTHLNGATRQEFFNGYIGEIIIFDRGLKTEERQAIEKYLGKKWGVAIS